MPRPKKDEPLKQIGAMVSPEMAERIKDYASFFRLSQSWVIHRLLARGLQAVEADGFLISPEAPIPRSSKRKTTSAQAA
jgi:hypothetical protein